MNYRTFWGLLLVFYVLLISMVYIVTAKTETSPQQDINTPQCSVTLNMEKETANKEGIGVLEIKEIDKVRQFLAKHNPTAVIKPEITSILFFLFPDGSMIAIEYAGVCGVEISKVDPVLFKQLMGYLKRIEV